MLLGDRGGSERQHEEERADSTMKEGRFQEGQARKASRGEAEARAGEWTQKISRTICRVLVSLLVWPKLRWEKRLGDQVPAHKMT